MATGQCNIETLVDCTFGRGFSLKIIIDWLFLANFEEVCIFYSSLPQWHLQQLRFYLASDFCNKQF